MRTSRTLGLLSAAATLAVAGLLGAATVDPFALTVTPSKAPVTVTILPGLITVASVTPAASAAFPVVVVTPSTTTATRPGRSP
jgi:hypothetical protein